MILIKERFLSADHIQHIYIKEHGNERCSVIVQMINCYAEFGKGYNPLDEEMAFELRRRIVKAIADYKSSDPPAIQQVDFPTYKEVHPEEDSQVS